MERTAPLLVRDLSLSPCLITPGTNHGSVHSLGAVDQNPQKRFTLYSTRPSKTTQKKLKEFAKERHKSHTVVDQ